MTLSADVTDESVSRLLWKGVVEAMVPRLQGILRFMAVWHHSSLKKGGSVRLYQQEGKI